MDYLESLEFHKFKDHLVILQFKNETVKFDRFKKPLVTDKYVDLHSWSVIYAEINKLIDENIRKCSWNNTKHNFRAMDLKISLKTIDKSKAIVNLKEDYKFDWIIQIKIYRSTADPDNVVKIKEEPIHRVKSFDEDNNENCLTIDDEPVQKRRKFKCEDDTERSTSKSAPLIQKNHDSKPRKVKMEKQSTLSGWMGSKKNEKKSTNSKNPVPTTSSSASPPKNAIDMISNEQLQRINAFLARSEKQDELKQQRKEELQDYEIWDCSDVKNEELVELTISVKHEIDKYFDNYEKDLYLDNHHITSMDITTSNILSSKQILFIMNLITKYRRKDGNATNEDILSEVALPYVIIKIFSLKFDLSMADAILRIKVQEEKKLLYNMNDSC